METIDYTALAAVTGGASQAPAFPATCGPNRDYTTTSTSWLGGMVNTGGSTSSCQSDRQICRQAVQTTCGTNQSCSAPLLAGCDKLSQ